MPLLGGLRGVILGLAGLGRRKPPGATWGAAGHPPFSGGRGGGRAGEGWEEGEGGKKETGWIDLRGRSVAVDTIQIDMGGCSGGGSLDLPTVAGKRKGEEEWGKHAVAVN